MALDAGRLRHRIELQRQVETQDSSTGAVTVVWQTFASLWCAIEPISGREFISAQSNMSECTVRLIIRHTAEVTAKQRARHISTGKLYEILAVLADSNTGLEYMTLPCRHVEPEE